MRHYLRFAPASAIGTALLIQSVSAIVMARGPTSAPTSDMTQSAAAPRLLPLPERPPSETLRVLRDPFRDPEWMEPVDDAPAPQLATPAAPVTTVVRPVLLGTLLSVGDRPIAVCALSGGQPRLLRPGDHIGRWLLDSVYPGGAVLKDSSGEVLLLNMRKSEALP